MVLDRKLHYFKMKNIVVPILLAFHFSCSSGQVYNEVIEELEKTLDNKDKYIGQKLAFIQKKKDTLHIYKASNDIRRQILVSLELVYEYQSFVSDSAQYYVNEAKAIAYQIKDISLISLIKIREGFVLLSSGLFKDSALR